MDPMVFREYSTNAVSNLKDLNWEDDVYGPDQAARPSLRTCPRRRGPASLMEMAVKVAADNVGRFDLQYLNSIHPELTMLLHEELGSLPGKPGDRSMDYVGRDQTTNLDMPQASNRSADASKKAVDGSNMVSRRFYHHIPLPTADKFIAYIKPLQPTGFFKFISHIRIAGPCQIKTEELLLLPSLKSLGVLEIIAPADESRAFPQVSDRILRSWSKEKDTFPRLSILKIHARYHLSERSLRYLSRFPALAMFEVLGRSEEWQQSDRLAVGAGWMHCNRDKATDPPYFSHRHKEPPQSSCAHVTEKISCPGRIRWLDPGCWACWAHTAIQKKPFNGFENAHDATAPWASDSWRPEVPFASLTLGSDRLTLESARLAVLDMSLIFFWRRSLFDAIFPPRIRIDGDETQDSITFQDSSWIREAANSLAKNGRKAASDQHAGGCRPKRRRQAGNIGDVLNSFQT